MTQLEKAVEDYRKGGCSFFNVNFVNDLTKITIALNSLDLDDEEDDVRGDLGDALVRLQDEIIERDEVAYEVFNFLVKTKEINIEAKNEEQAVKDVRNYCSWVFDACSDEELKATKDGYLRLTLNVVITAEAYLEAVRG